MHAADDTDVFLTLQNMRVYLDDLSEEHPPLCYREFYESPQSKRVVRLRAPFVAHWRAFGHMRERHHLDLGELAAQLDGPAAPRAGRNPLPTGDLWDMVCWRWLTRRFRLRSNAKAQNRYPPAHAIWMSPMSIPAIPRAV